MYRSAKCALGLLLIGSADVALAQLEEIVVTATKTGARDLQDTPIAITAVSGETAARSGVSTIRDIASLAPNLSVGENSGFSVLSIRGIGSTNVFAGSDPSTTLHVDGVYIARPFAQFFDFLDVERIEVLRGPQGTLYGRNSVGGTINVISRAPTDEFSLTARMTVGTYDLLQPEIALSGALVPGRVQASFAAMHRQHDAYRENVVPDAPDIENDDSDSARAQLRVQVTDRVDAVTRVDYFESSIRPSSFSKLLLPYSPVTDSILGDYHKIAHNYPSQSKVRVAGIAEDVTFRITDGMTLKSLTAYRENEITADIDSDASDADNLRSHPAEDQSQWSQEFTLNGVNEKMEYVLGAYYFYEDNQEQVIVENRLAGVDIRFLPQVKTSAWATFAQGTYRLSERLSVTAGARYTDEEKEIDQNAGLFSRASGNPLPGSPSIYSKRDKYSATTPKVGVEYRPVPDLLLYTSATRGFKSGGFDNTARNNDQGFKPEDLWSYEFGAKSTLLNRRLTINVSAFHYDYKDLQVQVAIAPGVSALSNAADVRMDGVEAEITAQPADGLQFGVSASYLDAKYERFPNATLLGQTFDASGRRLGTPRKSVGAFAEKRWDFTEGGEISLRADSMWRSESYSLHPAVPAQGSYAVANASVGYHSADRKWDLTLWARNIFDEEYVTSITTFTATFAGRPGEPRNAGVRFTYRY